MMSFAASMPSGIPLDSVNPSAAVSCSSQIDSPAAVSIRGLTHAYPPPRRQKTRFDEVSGAATTTLLDALVDVNFEIRPGEVLGLLGPNGSGKTTLFRVLATLLRPSQGAVSIFGYDLATQAQLVRQQLGIVFQMPSLDIKLSAEENLACQGYLYGLSGRNLRRRISSLLMEFELGDRCSEYIERFSGGMRRRVELAKALLHQPRLLLLDEPATGLDPGARLDLIDQLQRMQRKMGVTVALTTHHLEDADRCDRLAIMCKGKLVAVDTPAGLKARVGGNIITIQPAQSSRSDEICKLITEQFGPWPAASMPTVHHGKIYIHRDDGPAFVASLGMRLSQDVAMISVGKPTLEDVFLHLTGHTLWN